MKMTSKSGATLAAAAATLFLAGATMTTVAHAADGKCVGVNACKGKGACKGGANACKGQGFSMMTKEKCEADKGKFTAG